MLFARPFAFGFLCEKLSSVIDTVGNRKNVLFLLGYPTMMLANPTCALLLNTSPADMDHTLPSVAPGIVSWSRELGADSLLDASTRSQLSSQKPSSLRFAPWRAAQREHDFKR